MPPAPRPPGPHPPDGPRPPSVHLTPPAWLPPGPRPRPRPGPGPGPAGRAHTSRGARRPEALARPSRAGGRVSLRQEWRVTDGGDRPAPRRRAFFHIDAFFQERTHCLRVFKSSKGLRRNSPTARSLALFHCAPGPSAGRAPGGGGAGPINRRKRPSSPVSEDLPRPSHRSSRGRTRKKNRRKGANADLRRGAQGRSARRRRPGPEEGSVAGAERRRARGSIGLRGLLGRGRSRPSPPSRRPACRVARPWSSRPGPEPEPPAAPRRAGLAPTPRRPPRPAAARPRYVRAMRHRSGLRDPHHGMEPPLVSMMARRRRRRPPPMWRYGRGYSHMSVGRVRLVMGPPYRARMPGMCGVGVGFLYHFGGISM